MNNPELLLKSLDYKVGVNYNGLTYFGYYNNSHLLFGLSSETAIPPNYVLKHLYKNNIFALL
jgi:hypothetical protein